MAKARRPKMKQCRCCGNDLPRTWTACPHCGQPSFFPNVDAAEAVEEVTALKARYQRAKESARVRGCEGTIKKFEAVMKSSSAVMVCSISKLLLLATGHRDLYANWHEIERTRFPRLTLDPNDPDWDARRRIVEPAFFGEGVFRRIHYAALSLHDEGLSNYGSCSIVLREEMIAHRASAFEENTLVFVDRHNLMMADPEFPHGYRSSWARRHQLCVAKLARYITTKTKSTDFAKLLLKGGTKSISDRFVEIHIYGGMTLRTFKKVTVHRVDDDWEQHIDAIIEMESRVDDLEVLVVG